MGCAEICALGASRRTRLLAFPMARFSKVARGLVTAVSKRAHMRKAEITRKIAAKSCPCLPPATGRVEER